MHDSWIGEPRWIIEGWIDPERVARLLGLEAGDTGANLMLIDPFDPFVFEGAWEASGLRYAARSQIIADLLGSPPPGPAQATTLLGVVSPVGV